jgi:hypothetical protein
VCEADYMTSKTTGGDDSPVSPTDQYYLSCDDDEDDRDYQR